MRPRQLHQTPVSLEFIRTLANTPTTEISNALDGKAVSASEAEQPEIMRHVARLNVAERRTRASRH